MLYQTIIGVSFKVFPLRNALGSLEVWDFDYFIMRGEDSFN